MTDHSAPSQDDHVEAAPAAPRPAPPVPTPGLPRPPASPAAPPAQVGETGDAGETGDVLIDAALRGLDEAPPEDLDAQIEAGRRVHQTLQARLSDLGGE
jgi:hypothetical protein